MKRAVLGALAGYAAWTALWLAGNAGLAAAFPDEYEAFQAGGELAATGPLLAALALSVACSFVAGLVAAALARGARGAVPWMAVALLLTGIGGQASVWSRMPVWYHLTFLALLVPVCLAGGVRRSE